MWEHEYVSHYFSSLLINLSIWDSPFENDKAIKQYKIKYFIKLISVSIQVNY